jgi:hypothetical protein
MGTWELSSLCVFLFSPKRTQPTTQTHVISEDRKAVLESVRVQGWSTMLLIERPIHTRITAIIPCFVFVLPTVSRPLECHVALTALTFGITDAAQRERERESARERER